MDRVTYHEQTDMENILKLREVLRTLPEFSRDYFRAIDSTTTTKTRISYAYDIRIFFQFLIIFIFKISEIRLLKSLLNT